MSVPLESQLPPFASSKNAKGTAESPGSEISPNCCIFSHFGSTKNFYPTYQEIESSSCGKELIAKRQLGIIPIHGPWIHGICIDVDLRDLYSNFHVIGRQKVGKYYSSMDPVMFNSPKVVCLDVFSLLWEFWISNQLCQVRASLLSLSSPPVGWFVCLICAMGKWSSLKSSWMLCTVRTIQ